jgi:uncharacterized integral membrane protein
MVMRKFFSALVLIPLGLIFTVFAVANRHLVTVSFDPFNSTDPSVAVRMPLFVVIIAVAIMGVVAGGSATWFRQRHWRRSARQRRHDLIENRVHDVLDIPLIEVRVVFGDALNEFGFDHRGCGPCVRIAISLKIA